MGNKINFAEKRSLTKRTVSVPDLGESIILTPLSVKQMNSIDDKDHATGLAGLRQLSFAIVDDNGTRLYATEEDFENLREMPVGVFRALMTQLNEMHGISREETDEAVKKFVASRNTASASA